MLWPFGTIRHLKSELAATRDSLRRSSDLALARLDETNELIGRIGRLTDELAQLDRTLIVVRGEADCYKAELGELSRAKAAIARTLHEEGEGHRATVARHADEVAKLKTTIDSLRDRLATVTIKGAEFRAQRLELAQARDALQVDHDRLHSENLRLTEDLAASRRNAMIETARRAFRA